MEKKEAIINSLTSLNAKMDRLEQLVDEIGGKSSEELAKTASPVWSLSDALAYIPENIDGISDRLTTATNELVNMLMGESEAGKMVEVDRPESVIAHPSLHQ